jgi:hypothetical protein
VSLWSRIREFLSSSGAGGEAAAREEYGMPDRGETALDQNRSGSLVEWEEEQLAKDELDELKPPRDPAP